MNKGISIQDRKIGKDFKPFIIAEVGINHEGHLDKALKMVDDAAMAGCECVKFQTHIIEDEMIPNDVVPIHTKETIWDIMDRCKLSEKEEIELKKYVESRGMIFLSTPFSRDAANRLEKMGVSAYKIGSGECNNYPLVEHIANFGKPIIISTGMNDINSVSITVEILRKYKIPFALMHCTSLYPSPYDKVRLGALPELQNNFKDAVIGLSDHSIGIYTGLAAIALGASIIEKHFTSDKSWPGPDIALSIDPFELKELIVGSAAVHSALGGHKDILPEEQPTMDFAYASVVTIKNMKNGEVFSLENIWAKRPGTGEIRAAELKNIIGKKAERDIPINSQLKYKDIGS